jgi:hypothetical protein
LYPGVVCDADVPGVPPRPEAENPAAAAANGPAPKAKKKSGFAHFLRRIFGGG